MSALQIVPAPARKRRPGRRAKELREQSVSTLLEAQDRLWNVEALQLAIQDASESIDADDDSLALSAKSGRITRFAQLSVEELERAFEHLNALEALLRAQP